MVKDQSVGKGIPSWFDTNSNEYEEQKIELYDYYDEQFIIFQPIYSYQNKDGCYHKNLKILDLKAVPQSLTINTRFKTIPKVNLDRKTFERKIKSEEYFTLDFYPGDIYNAADYIMCDSYLYFSNSWHFNDTDTFNWKYTNDKNSKITCVKIENKTKIMSSSSKFGSSIVFIEDEYIQELDRQAEDFYFDSSHEEIENNEVVIEIKRESNGEFEMLESFKKNVINSNLCYDYEDLVNLHICAKSSPLTILAGMSGTGKTQLALQYAKMLDTQENNGNLLFVSVSPSFTEPDDVLGYLNPSNGLYIPADTGLVDFLKRAEKHTDKMYMAIFDEMNLSQIEYWFAPFISVLEKDPESRFLTLYDKKSYCVNYDDNKIKINNNVLFIGTINLDETTKNISDRLLDRAFVINLKKKKFIDYFSQNLENEFESTPITYGCSSSKYNQWRSKRKPIESFSQKELAFLDELHSIISKYDEQKGVSFRVLKNIGTYISNIPKDDNDNYMIEKRHAFDLVLKQTVMKKLSGPDNRLIKLIGKINNIGDEPQDSMIIDLFNKYSEISDFSECKESLKRKAEDLFTYGYTR